MEPAGALGRHTDSFFVRGINAFKMPGPGSIFGGYPPSGGRKGQFGTVLAASALRQALLLRVVYSLRAGLTVLSLL